MNNYGAMTWDGLTDLDSSGSVATHAEISLNTYWLGSDTSDNTWKAIACHEMGHVLGLDHCKKDGNVSIMIEDGVSVYYDQLNLSTPQQMDINAIADKYQYLR